MNTQLVKMLSSVKGYEAGKEYEIDSETASKWLDIELCEKVNEGSLDSNLTRVIEKALTEREDKLVKSIEKSFASAEMPVRNFAVARNDDDKSFNDWFRSAYADSRGENKEYFRNKYLTGTKAQNTQVGTAGGYLVPQTFYPNLIRVATEESVVRPRAQALPMEGDITWVPALDHSTNARGGVVAYYTAEVNTGITETSVNFKQLKFEARELNALLYCTNSMLQDSAFDLNAWTGKLFSDALMAREDLEFLKGNGVNGPLGIINSTCALTFSRTTASHVKFEDIAGMEGKFLPSSNMTNKGVWIAHQSTMGDIIYLKDGAGNPIYIPNGRDGGFPMLRGRPVIWTGKTVALGSTGDLILADLSYYGAALRSDIAFDFSEHIAFHKNQIAFRARMRHDGGPLLTSSVLLDDGATSVSPFVLLA